MGGKLRMLMPARSGSAGGRSLQPGTNGARYLRQAVYAPAADRDSRDSATHDVSGRCVESHRAPFKIGLVRHVASDGRMVAKFGILENLFPGAD